MAGTYSTTEGKVVRLSPEQEARNLVRHGTSVTALSAATILQTARTDIQTKILNNKIRAYRKIDEGARTVDQHNISGLTPRKFAFAQSHVVAATDAIDLIKIAIEKRDEVIATEDKAQHIIGSNLTGKGLNRVDANTLRIYLDKPALEAALALAKAAQ